MTDCILERPPAQTDLFTQFLAARHADGMEHVVSGRERQSECPRADTGPIRVGACELHHGDVAGVLPTLPAGSVDLIVTSPPYDIGKPYETRTPLTHYVAFLEQMIGECHRLLGPRGAMSWQVGNHVHKGEVIPIDSLIIPLFRDLGMKARNRVVWTFGHGLHCSKHLSGRHETIVWATKSADYTFDLDAIRVPKKYPGKRYYKGPKKGDLSGNPKGRNPGDVWDISNVKHNHLEKLDHPSQFPEELIDRLVLSLTAPDDVVLDPFAGSGTIGALCNRLGRKSILVEREESYVWMTAQRLAGHAV